MKNRLVIVAPDNAIIDCGRKMDLFCGMVNELLAEGAAIKVFDWKPVQGELWVAFFLKS